MFPGLILVLSLVLLFLAARRAITVADLEIRDGDIRVVHGGLAPRILSDLQDVVRHPPVRAARVRIVRSQGRAEVRISGALAEERAQRIRNVIGSVPLVKLANARRRR